MLQLKGIYKTFNAGTVNEKRAIDNLNLTLEAVSYTHLRRAKMRRCCRKQAVCRAALDQTAAERKTLCHSRACTVLPDVYKRQA